MFCRAWSGSKLFAKVISRWQKLPLAELKLFWYQISLIPDGCNYGKDWCIMSLLCSSAWEDTFNFQEDTLNFQILKDFFTDMHYKKHLILFQISRQEEYSDKYSFFFLHKNKLQSTFLTLKTKGLSEILLDIKKIITAALTLKLPITTIVICFVICLWF